MSATVEVDAEFRILGFVDVSKPIQVVCDQSSGFAVDSSRRASTYGPVASCPSTSATPTGPASPGGSRSASTGPSHPGLGVDPRATLVFEVGPGDSDTSRAEIAYTGADRGGKFTGWIVATDITSGATLKSKSILCGTFVGPPPPWRLIVAAATALGDGPDPRLLASSNRANALRTTDGSPAHQTRLGRAHPG